MGRPRVQHHCIQCGKPCPQRGRRNGGFKCINCAISNYEKSNEQIRSGQGEYYEKWLHGLNAAIQRRLEQARHADTDPDRTT